MNLHPYKTKPQRSFWSSSMTEEFEPRDVPDAPPFRVSSQDRFMSAGTCFASNIRRYIEAAGLQHTVTEPPHPLFPESAEAAQYEAFSARYGYVFTARQMVQLLDRAVGNFSPVESCWVVDGEWIDPYRPGLLNRARSRQEFEALTAQHLGSVRAAVEASSVFIFTLGLTEAWLSTLDGAVFPSCPGTVAGHFDPERHAFRNFSAAEVIEDLERMISLARNLSPRLKVILMVSPVPLIATATERHVLVATTYSKAVLRVAAEEISTRLADVAYFPAYELLAGPQAASHIRQSDGRNVSERAVAELVETMLGTFMDDSRTALRGGSGNGSNGPPPLVERLMEAADAAAAASCEDVMSFT